MDDKIRSFFDKVRAEDALQSRTREALRRKAERPKPRALQKRLMAACVSMMLLSACGIAYGQYFMPMAYVDVDINPSIALTLNRFDRVIDAKAYSAEDDALLSSISLRYKTYDDALASLIDATIQSRQLTRDALISISVQTQRADLEAALLQGLSAATERSLSDHHQKAQMDVFPVTEDTRSHAHTHGVSPAKYMAISELLDVDASTTFESCAGHSLKELRRLVQQAGHHEQKNQPTTTVPTDHNRGGKRRHHGGH